jgi:hypothetical protein
LRAVGSSYFDLLVRQVPCVAVGIDGNITHGKAAPGAEVHSLTPALGEKLGESFIEATANRLFVLKDA